MCFFQKGNLFLSLLRRKRCEAFRRTEACAACPRPGRGGEDPHRRQRAARHQAGQQPDGERLAPEAAGPGQFGADPAQKRHALHPEPDQHHEQPADGQEHKGKLPPILSGSLLFIESTIPDTLFFQPAFPFSDYCLKRGKAQFVESNQKNHNKNRDKRNVINVHSKNPIMLRIGKQCIAKGQTGSKCDADGANRKNPPHSCWERGGTFWRIGWDSNPRAACATT